MGRRIIVRGGDLPAAKSSSGIEVGGKTLEEILAEEESKEIGEQLTPDNLVTYHKGYDRHKPYKESNGTTRILTRREINAEQWEKIMENQKTIEGIVAAILLSGREVTGREIQENCIRRLGITKNKYSQRSTYLYHKTDFGKFITSRREGKGASYKLVPAALECKPEELLYFVYKNNHKARENVLAHHKGLRPYLEAKKSDEPKQQLTTKGTTSDEPAAPVSTMARAIETAISQALGVNVIVKGRVDIVFRWE